MMTTSALVAAEAVPGVDTAVSAAPAAVSAEVPRTRRRLGPDMRGIPSLALAAKRRPGQAMGSFPTDQGICAKVICRTSRDAARISSREVETIPREVLVDDGEGPPD